MTHYDSPTCTTHVPYSVIMYRVSKMAFDCELGLRPSRQDILQSLSNEEEVQNTISIPVSR